MNSIKPLNIVLIGYGKMGKTIEEIAVKRGHEIVLKIDVSNQQDLNADNLSKADVAIEFTGPESAFNNIMLCIEAGLPLVCGSTGWLSKINEVTDTCNLKGGAFLYASNFSIGVNLFFELNKKLAALMAGHEEYNASIKEIHHTQKKDSPSGTAITLAEQIINIVPYKNKWVNFASSNTADLVITSKRIDPAPGTHSITYHSAIDDIEIKHTAHNRQGFALGAILAAEFIEDKKGIFSMQDVLNINF